MTRKLRIRRFCTALLTMLAFLVSSVEVMFPEVHDGDASVELAAMQPNGSVGDAVTLVQSGVALASIGDSNADAPAHSAHGWHVEHCGHSHVATNARVVGQSMLRAPSCAVETPIAELVSFQLPPHVRPPIL